MWGPVAQRLESRTGNRGVLGSNPADGTLLRNFGNSIYLTLPVSFGADTKDVGSLYLVCTPGEVKYPTHGANV